MKITTLPLDFESGQIKLTVYPALLRDENEMILVDCGYPGFMPVIETGLNKIGLSLTGLTKIIITHHDHDHMGALKEIKDACPAVEILCTQQEKPYITGKEKSLRLRQAEELHETLPESEKEESLIFQRFIASVPKADAVSVIRPGEVLPVCGGVEVIDTKGHMPGHISLYVRSEKTLISGDALVIEDGKLCMAYPEYLLSPEDAFASVKHLLDYKIDKIICYHGGVFTGDIKSALEVILHDYQRNNK